MFVLGGKPLWIGFTLPDFRIRGSSLKLTASLLFPLSELCVEAAGALGKFGMWVLKVGDGSEGAASLSPKCVKEERGRGGRWTSKVLFGH